MVHSLSSMEKKSKYILSEGEYTELHLGAQTVRLTLLVWLYFNAFYGYVVEGYNFLLYLYHIGNTVIIIIIGNYIVTILTLLEHIT